ncbi:MAG: calcium/proton exchanger [Acidimicrobiia bacterium]|nr:calcium/proton exchanger [Acidimicrobiia bacterium]
MKAGWAVVGAAVLVPVSLLSLLFHSEPTRFLLAAAAMVPLAGLLGDATEELAIHAGPRLGGLLNATFGNAAELIVGVFLVANGELAVVRSSITGSIIDNLLLVLGASFFAGGLRFRELRFSAAAAGTGIASMAIAVAGILMPALYARGAHPTEFRIEAVSIGVAVVLLIMYGASLLFTFVTHPESGRGAQPSDEEQATMSLRGSIGLLALAGALVAVEAELLTNALEPTVRSLGLSRLWVGLILVPIVANAAEHSTAVRAALRDKSDLAVAIAIGSSTQVALVVAPLLVFAGLAFGHHLHLDFTPFDISAIGLGVIVVAFVCYDGITNWLEGAQLMAVYAILAITSFYLGVR